MSVRVHGTEPWVNLIVGYYTGYGDDNLLEIVIQTRSRGDIKSTHYTKVTVRTKDLVLAIKQVEEERDAEREKSRPYRKEPRSSYDESVLKGAIHRTIHEFREVFRRAGFEPPHGEEAYIVVRDLERCKTWDELSVVYTRIKESYSFTISREIWYKSFYYLEDKKTSSYGSKSEGDGKFTKKSRVPSLKERDSGHDALRPKGHPDDIEFHPWVLTESPAPDEGS